MTASTPKKTPPSSPGQETEMLKVQTSRFGEVEIQTAKVISLTSPFPGFPEASRFFLRPHSEESPFMWFQSLENPQLAFVVISPTYIVADYAPGITASIKEELAADDVQDIDILIILTIPSGSPRDITANLLGPIYINAGKRLARQVVLDPAKYDPCHQIATGKSA